MDAGAVSSIRVPCYSLAHDFCRLARARLEARRGYVLPRQAREALAALAMDTGAVAKRCPELYQAALETLAAIQAAAAVHESPEETREAAARAVAMYIDLVRAAAACGPVPVHDLEAVRALLAAARPEPYLDTTAVDVAGEAVELVQELCDATGCCSIYTDRDPDTGELVIIGDLRVNTGCGDTARAVEELYRAALRLARQPGREAVEELRRAAAALCRDTRLARIYAGLPPDVEIDTDDTMLASIAAVASLIAPEYLEWLEVHGSEARGPGGAARKTGDTLEARLPPRAAEALRGIGVENPEDGTVRTTVATLDGAARAAVALALISTDPDWVVEKNGQAWIQEAYLEAKNLLAGCVATQPAA